MFPLKGLSLVENITTESVYLFMRLLVADNILAFGQKLLPFLYYLAMVLFFTNLGGISIYAFSASSYIAVTLILSLIVNYMVTRLSLIFQKIYYFNHFFPLGSPRPMGFLLVFIEIISWFSRILSLAIRLFANITAGHILLKILSTFCLIFFFSFSIYIFLTVIPATVISTLVILESVISILQAYVFISLAAMYFSGIIGEH